MNAPTRYAFLGLAQGAVPAAALGAIGVRFIASAEAMPVAPKSGTGRDNQESRDAGAIGSSA